MKKLSIKTVALSEFVAAKGNGAKAESKGQRRKVFAAPGKKVLSGFIHPLRDGKTVLQTALREEPTERWMPDTADRMNTPDTAERRVVPGITGS
ncbi:hypothetical protein ATT74_24375 [Salmonella enterica subsp. enterica serovar Panama]|nr:hypothetical protein [Salmonella enterica subsp. enterica serovar Amager]EBV5220635.1 hypothetical protein [Salmonella enterica subsp. enterica serovar Amager]EBW4030504.1 hypothetical protein [Salmonella enterica subsp. enterica serovar Newport]ECT5252733.1 hypothetical protein [Salmonella enterica subsp. enterica serovar Panama]